MKIKRILFRLINLLVIFTMIFTSPMSAMAAVWTDQADYAPGAIVTISGDNSDGAGYLPGETVHVDVLGPNDYAAACEGVADDTGAWSCQVTLWDSLLAVGEYSYTTTGLTSNVSQSGSFTDAAGSTNKVYQHWADGDVATGSIAEWNNNILSANKSDYFEGEVIPHVFVYKASNQVPLVNGQSYSFNVTYNYYQQNTNSGGFAYITTFNISRVPEPFNATDPYIVPTSDASFTNGGGMQGAFYTVDADITLVSGVTYLGAGTKDGFVTITFTYTGETTTKGIAEIYYGLYVAEPGMVPDQGGGPTLGAHAWTGGSLQTTVDINGSGATSIQLNPAAIIAGEISGVKFNDLDGDGIKDEGEPLLAGWIIQLCADAFCATVLDTAETDANGAYTFSVTPDADKLDGQYDNDPYYVREVLQDGWLQTAPGTFYYGPLLVTPITSQYLHQNFGNRQGYLKINKVFDPLTSGFSGTFPIVYNCGAGDITVNLAAGESTIIGPYPIGTSCSVSEPTLPTAPDGWVFGMPSISPDQPVTIGSTTLVTEVTVTNSIDLDQGYLKISKIFDPLTSGFTGTFAIVYNCGAGDVIVNLAAGESTTVGPFYTGTVCNISETTLPTPPTGWTFGSPVISGSPATIVKGDVASAVEVSVENSITRDTGSLEIVKTLINPDGAAIPASFLVDYDCGAGYTGHVSVAPGSPATISGIPTGSVCSVTEVAPTPIAGYTWGAITYSPASVTIAAKGGTFTITVGNSITRDRGNLKLIKTLIGGPAGYTGPFQIDYDCDGTEYDGFVTVSVGSPAMISGIPTGTQCTISETLPVPPAGYAFGTPTFSPSATVTIHTKDSTVEVTTTNTLGQNLIVTKTAVPSFTRTWEWTITKDYDATYDLFAGGSVTHGYKVSVTPTSTDSAWKVVGVITITNPNVWDVPLTSLVDATNIGGTCVLDDLNQATAVILAGDSIDVPYTCTWVMEPTSYTGMNTATVTWDNDLYASPTNSASNGMAFEFTNPAEIDPVITVDDSNLTGESWSANRAYAEWTYAKDFACSSDPADYTGDGKYDYFLTNTATINETTGDSDTATVTVNCYAPVVSKTAVGTYNERHNWDVTKTVSPVSQSAFAGDTVSYEWTVVVTESVSEETFQVAGEITVLNPAPMEMVVDLVDVLGGGTPSTISTCNNGAYVAGKLTIPANTTATCAYIALPEGRTDTVNNVTATLNDISFDATSAFDWTVNVIRGSAMLDDDQNPSFPLEITEGGTWTYLEQYTCSMDKSAYDAATHKYTFGESNTAALTSGDFNDSSTATTMIDCYVPTISKDANGSYDEIHDWEVFKSVNTTSQTAFAGERKNFTWTVRVDETTHGEDYLVTGDIVVTNPNPEDALTVALSDALDDGSVATIGPCTGGTLVGSNLTVPAGGTATCGYTVTPTGDLVAFAGGLPSQVTMSVQYPYSGGPSYFPVTTISGGGALNGTYEGWCVDTDHTIDQNTNYTANVYSSYEDLPAGLVEHPENFDLVNWIINQNFVGRPSNPDFGLYTYSDVQYAIWTLIDDQVSNSGLYNLNINRAAQIVAAARASGEGFTPTCGDFIAVVLQPVGGQQNITIAQVTFASLGVSCAESNTVTAVLNGIEFPASAEILWTANPINATATLDDDQKSDWPITVSADATFTYQDPQGYTCSSDPAAYINGFYQYNESNTALLTFSTGSDTATASTAVRCYAPVVSKTAAGAYTERHDWNVEKTVDPTSQVAFAGDTVSYEWTVSVTEEVFEESFVVTGAISVRNPRPDDGNMVVKLSDVLSDGFVPTITGCTGGTWNAINKTVAVPANTTAVCSYAASLTYTDDANAPTSNTVTAELMVGTTHFITTASDVVEWSANVIRGSATLDDEQNPIFPLDLIDGGTWNYIENHTCSINKNAYDTTTLKYTFGEDNIATLTSGDWSDSASASTAVTCYWPQIDLTKSGDELSKIGDEVAYTITLFNNTPIVEGLRALSCTISDEKIGFTKTVELASGAKDENIVTFTIPNTLDDPFVNDATVTCSPLDSTFTVSDSASWSTNLFQPKVEITKAGPLYATSGDIITYTFTITNKSSSDSPNLMLDSISDNKLGDLESAALAAGCDNLVYNGTCTFTASFTLPDVGLQAVSHKNIVTVHYHPAGFSNDITDTDDHTVLITPRGQLTDTSFCPLANNQFRLLYHLESAPNIYRLQASNPGQFYYNSFYFGEPGSSFTMTIQIPYPFMTQEGAGNPIQVHDGTGLTSSGCFNPNPSLSGFNIATQAMTPTSPAGNQIITPEDYTTRLMGGSTTVTISGIVPVTGMAYVTIHLDYGLKKTGGWKTTGTLTTNPVTGAASADMRNGSGTGPITIHGYEVYSFSRTVGSDTATTQPTSYNEIKKFAGFLGFVTNSTDGTPQEGVRVEIYSPTNALLATLYTDEDGYFMFEYKHKAKSATYTIKVPAYNKSIAVTVKANGFAAVDIELP